MVWTGDNGCKSQKQQFIALLTGLTLDTRICFSESFFCALFSGGILYELWIRTTFVSLFQEAKKNTTENPHSPKSDGGVDRRTRRTPSSCPLEGTGTSGIVCNSHVGFYRPSSILNFVKWCVHVQRCSPRGTLYVLGLACVGRRPVISDVSSLAV